MRKIVFILCLLAFVVSSCERTVKKQPEQVIPEPEKPAYKFSKIFTDTFEFIKYKEPEALFFVKKENRKHVFLEDLPVGSIVAFNRGDTVEIGWEIDSVWTVDNNDSLLIKSEIAVSIKKIKDGKLSVFQKTRKLPGSYFFMDNDGSIDQSMLMNDVDYFLATVSDEKILNGLNDENGGDMQIYISKYKSRENTGDEPSFAVRIDKFNDGNTETFVRFGIEYADENTEIIYYQFDEKKQVYIRIEK